MRLPVVLNMSLANLEQGAPEQGAGEPRLKHFLLLRSPRAPLPVTTPFPLRHRAL